MKLLNCKNLSGGELSKIGHHFRNKFVFFNEKNWKDSMIFDQFAKFNNFL